MSDEMTMDVEWSVVESDDRLMRPLLIRGREQ